ncbi:hypothetical protein BLA60_26920 [Actinophytocola xinjiangensis]|uniref:Restriction endonuclease NotI n=1 Tax=Actinophytocola xinjiangensis TaxID=485602 RepID=A0A7Z1AXC2_9PSEU|nr:hypothetical protein BLA60_26920 [Actinophytocola xinjiangensis]
MRRGTLFPIVEAYGFPHDCTTAEAQETWDAQQCPFSNTRCEKKVQYNFGYCSVVYAAAWDKGRPQPYAVCDHRLDGEPINWALSDYFGDEQPQLVSEVTALSDPKLNIDYVAFIDDEAHDETALIAIEAQAIDLRGGGVGPAWRAWEDGKPEQWRAYFTAEAKDKNRRDTVDYGVNTGNVYKRLATQVLVKGEYLKEIDVPLYVIMQHSILQQLRTRVNFTTVGRDDPWDITFGSFEYTGQRESNGQLEFSFVEAVRTTLDNYRLAFMMSSAAPTYLREDFIEKVKKKAGSSTSQTELF